MNKKQVDNMKTAYWILIHTTRNEIFFGLTTDEIASEAMTLNHAQMVVHYEAKVKGVLGLASCGPTSGCRITEPVDELFVRGVDWACKVRAQAVPLFQEKPWSR